MRERFVIKAPGKLVLLGEYAVLEESVPAVVTAISESIYCLIAEHDKIIFTSKRIKINKIEYEFSDKQLHLLSDVEETDVLKFSKNAMEITLRYLEEKGVKLKKFEINILSDLANNDGIKYGFGSSAAVTVAIVSAILNMHGAEINGDANREIIFKLSAIAHFLSQGSGSGVDIAAATYGGMFVYHSFTADWMKRRIQKLTSVRAMVLEQWKFFRSERVLILFDFFLCVGWTGKAASTKNFLDEVKKVKFSDSPDDVQFYQDFLKTNKNLINLFLHGIKNNKKELIGRAIQINKNLLRELASRAGVEMETENLSLLINVAKKLGFEAKFSGAGGGDCGYAIVYDENSVKELKAMWKKYGIEPLDVKLEEFGVCEVDFAVKEKRKANSRDTLK
jgi:phosphomevalonate kinase